MVDALSVVHSDPEISGGMPVFRGTRVPVQALFDYLEGGETLVTAWVVGHVVPPDGGDFRPPHPAHKQQLRLT